MSQGIFRALRKDKGFDDENAIEAKEKINTDVKGSQDITKTKDADKLQRVRQFSWLKRS